MNILKAIEILIEWDIPSANEVDKDLRDAVDLGIEALKRHRDRGTMTFSGMQQLLPGETKDEERGLTMTYLPEHRTCPECEDQATMTAWRPAPGLDRFMREYKCHNCLHEWYYIPKHLPPDKQEPSF